MGSTKGGGGGWNPPPLRGGVPPPPSWRCYPPPFVEFSTFLRKITEHFSNGDREVKDQIKTRRGFFCSSLVAQIKYLLVGCFRWHGQDFRHFSKFSLSFSPKFSLKKIPANFFFENFFGHVSAKNKTKKSVFLKK